MPRGGSPGRPASVWTRTNAGAARSGRWYRVLHLDSVWSQSSKGDRLGPTPAGSDSAVVGARNWGQIADLLGALDHLDLSDDELAEIAAFATDCQLNLFARSSEA